MRRCVLLFIGLSVALVQLKAQAIVSFSQPGGRYADSFLLSIETEELDGGPYQIRYTLNGGTPSVESFLYEHPLKVDSRLFSTADIYKIPNTIERYKTPLPKDVERVVVVRAAAFNAQGECCSNVATATYVIEALYNRTITLPILSLCVDSVDLFDLEKGIFVPGASFDPARPEETGNYYFSGREYEKEGYVEMIGEEVLLSQDCGVRTHGHISRRYAQKGLSLYARKEYGRKNFDAVFDGQDFKCKRLVLRPFSCAWTPMGFQDYYTQQLAGALNTFSSLAVRPVVLFLNGEYWGIYYLEEKPDEHYIQSHFGIDDKQVRLVRDWEGHDKNMDFDSSFVALMDWLETADLSDERQYEQLCRLVDVVSFTDYVLFETFIGNRDWPANNMRCWSADGSPWRFIFHDGDAIRSMDFSAVTNALYDGDSLTWPTSAQSTLLLRRLLQNPHYRDSFVQRVCEMARLYSYSSRPQMRHAFDQAVALLKPEIAAQTERFGFPKSVRRWQHAVGHQQKYWKHRSRDFQREWIQTINERYGTSYPVRRFPWWWLVLAVVAVAATAVGVACYRKEC
ncbi:MAG: CotH kinase family protein [Bacteroidales bacterium]|nr:CotH kinase family protein [Bacteroidales bacterium]